MTWGYCVIISKIQPALLRLLYISTPVTGLQKAEIISILANARTHNAKEGITGVLWYGSGHFIQVLEGPEVPVLKLYGKIKEDRRHENCHLVQSSQVDRRLFSGWSMGSLSESCGMKLTAEQLAEFRLRKDAGIEMLRTMRDLLKKLEGSNADGRPAFTPA